MRKLILIILILFSTNISFAYTTTPEAIVGASGINESSALYNFTAFGENAAGIISGANYSSGIGLAAIIFTPLLPQAGASIPTVSTPEGNCISYPNPFNPDTEIATIAYKLAQDAEVKVYILDISGVVIKTIVTSSSNRAADGFSRVSWDGESSFGEAISNGLYLAQIVSSGKIIGKAKIIAIR